MKLIINDNIFKVKLCSTPETIKKGMSNQVFDENFNGMYFLLPQKKHNCFWMKDCVIPLDIIFIKNNEIVNVYSNCPPCYKDEHCESYCSESDSVLEVKGGTCEKLSIKKGDLISFSLI